MATIRKVVASAFRDRNWKTVMNTPPLVRQRAVDSDGDRRPFLFWLVWGGVALIAADAAWWGYYFYISLALLPSLSTALLLWWRHGRRAIACMGAALAGLVISPLGYGWSVYHALLAGTAPGNAWQMGLNRAVFDSFGFDLLNPRLRLGLTLSLIALLQWPLLRQNGARRDGWSLLLWLAANSVGVLLIVRGLDALVSAGVSNIVLLYLGTGIAWAAVIGLALHYLLHPQDSVNC